MSENGPFIYKIEWSALLTFIGIVFLFSFSVGIILILPNFVDESWIAPSSAYQKQVYENADPSIYISSSGKERRGIQTVQHLKNGEGFLAFQESETTRIEAPAELEKYVTRYGDKTLKLTSRLLLLRPKDPASKKEGTSPLILTLFSPEREEAIAVRANDSLLENWADENWVEIEEKSPKEKTTGTIYTLNPIEYRISKHRFGKEEFWEYDPKGTPVQTLEELKRYQLDFTSRKELIALGEHIYAIEGCWYCHTDQTRTLVQDVVLNGSDTYPSPPSTANEYIYQSITFPGTRRIGPDLSRTGVKRPSRDWHRGHFWAPKTASAGSIMPAFQHFFDNDPRGTGKNQMGIPNYKFEAIYQYLMTKGTRITSPNKAWWLGKDPVNTKAIIEGRGGLPHAR